MNARRIGSLARRIVDQFRRDHRSLALVFVAPVVIMALLGWVLRDQQLPPARLGVVDPTGQLAERIAEAVGSEGWTVREMASAAAAEAALRGAEVEILLIVPVGFAPSPPGSPLPLEIVVAGSDPGADAARVGTAARLLGSIVPGGASSIVTRRLFGSPDADALETFAPALLGFFGFFFVFILTGVSFLRERVGGTLERLLATPIRRAEIVAGYSAGFGLFATIQVAVILAFSLSALALGGDGSGLPRVAIGLGVPSAGSPLLAFLVVLLLALGAVNLGIFLSTFARTELQILQFIPLVIVPQGLLGGVFWSIESLPDVLQPVARAMPLTYAVEGLREVMVRGADLASRTLQMDIVFLAGTAVLFVVLAGATIRREVV